MTWLKIGDHMVGIGDSTLDTASVVELVVHLMFALDEKPAADALIAADAALNRIRRVETHFGEDRGVMRTMLLADASEAEVVDAIVAKLSASDARELVRGVSYAERNLEALRDQRLGDQGEWS